MALPTSFNFGMSTTAQAPTVAGSDDSMQAPAPLMSNVRARIVCVWPSRSCQVAVTGHAILLRSWNRDSFAGSAVPEAAVLLWFRPFDQLTNGCRNLMPAVNASWQPDSAE